MFILEFELWVHWVRLTPMTNSLIKWNMLCFFAYISSIPRETLLWGTGLGWHDVSGWPAGATSCPAISLPAIFLVDLLGKLKQNLRWFLLGRLIYGNWSLFQLFKRNTYWVISLPLTCVCNNSAWLKMCLSSCFKKPHTPRHQGVPQIGHHVWFETWCRNQKILNYINFIKPGSHHVLTGSSCAQFPWTSCKTRW